jgi:hypothetical protein
MTYIECLDSYDDSTACAGEVSYYYALSGSGLTWPRCEGHYALYVERVQEKLDEVRKAYPDSPSAPPAWFDATYAGEQWEDEY